MRGDWMDEARRFEDTDKAISESLARENEYWKRVGGHPPVDQNYDAPRTYECEEHGCAHIDMAFDDGNMGQCGDCDGWFCPAHLVPDVKGHEELCYACYNERTVQRLAVEGD